ncbi:universal stress protein [uncultured Tenacibaculum sp.]|uniref:universal stress protein n=1 Tax=uncultured Tenacibaculum sp. TaxID=174713 RepID=UPI0026113226|nr:universal stress protein [uncultured Tenacibaculum sp.]
MKNILLPTDFSENSWNSIAYALQLFDKEKCTFHLLNTYMPSIYHMDYMPSGAGYTGVADALKESSTIGLEVFKSKILKDYVNERHTIETISSLNMIISEIREVVIEKSIDIIVMGTKGASGIIETILGTNTMTVINDIKCPTIAVPESFKFSKLKKILFPTDFELFYQSEHLNLIIDLAEKHNSEIHLLHVLGKNTQELTENQERNIMRLKSLLKDIKLISHFENHKHIANSIDDFLLKMRVDLLVMMNNKNSFFDNVFFKPIINKIGFHLKTPFLVLPSNK